MKKINIKIKGHKVVDLQGKETFEVENIKEVLEELIKKVNEIVEAIK